MAAVAMQSATQAPESDDAEQAVLGACLAGTHVYTKVARILQADDFFYIKNQWVFEAMCRLHGRSEEIDYLTVCEELRSMGKLNELGGPAYITWLVANHPTYAHAMDYALIVSRLAYRRRALRLAGEITDGALNETIPFVVTIGKIMDSITTLSTQFNKTQRLLSGEQQSDFKGMLEDFRTQLDSEQSETPVASGIKALDDVLSGGFFKGWLVVLASRMKVGKTRLKVTMAMNAARRGHQVVFYTTEETPQAIMRKMITMLTGVSETRLRLNTYTPLERMAIRLAIEHLAKLPIQVYCGSGWTIPQLRQHYVEEHIPTHGAADVLFVDYIQRFEEHRRGYAEKEHSIYGKIAQDLKNITTDFGLLVITSSQYNREGANGNGSNDTLSGSDQIAREADLVMGIDRPETYENSTDKKRSGEVTLKITAARHDDLTGREIRIGFNKNGGWFCDPVQRDLDPMMLQNARILNLKNGAAPAAMGD